VVIQLQDGENYVPVWAEATGQDGARFPYKGW